MCRFLAYLGPELALETLVTRPPNSLVHQSFDAELHDPLNGDGFGMAWYVPQRCPTPALYRDITPAWSNENLLDLVRVTSSGCFLGHVRAASKGMSVIRTNCHPFRHGRYAFMHNGFIPDFARIKRALLDGVCDEAFGSIQGTTDSEHLFALFIDALQLEPSDRPPLEAMTAALRQTLVRAVELKAAAGIDEACFLNLAVTDGERLLVSRFTDGPPLRARTLYTLTGAAFVDDGDGSTTMRAAGPGEGALAVLVASEPLDTDPRWAPVLPNHIVRVERGGALELVAVS